METTIRKYRCVLYFSKEDKYWIAHGLYTDQIGTGRTITAALRDFKKGIDSLFELAEKQKDIRVWRKAPEEIFEMSKNPLALVCSWP